MAYKIYKKGAFLVLDNTVTGDLKEINSQNVQIAKGRTSLDKYEILENGVSRLSIGLADIQDENGAAYSESAWDTFRYSSVGSVNSSEVANPYPAPSTLEVDITSAQILAMGTTPIELLPAAGAGKYYDVEKVILEFTHVTTAYTYAESYISLLGNRPVYFSEILTGGADAAVILNPSMEFNDTVENINYTSSIALNQKLILRGYNNTNPTLGDGTLRAIITYALRTFGA